MELHANQLIVIVFSIDYAHRFDIVLFQFIVLLIKWDKMFFLNVLSLFARPQVKILILKFRLRPRKTSISGISLTFFY